MLYVLALEHGKFYVGYSARLNNERIMQHFRGDGAAWTRRYKPVMTLFIDDFGRQEDENRLTLTMMRKYQWFNVRGGSWCQVHMSCPPDEILNETHHSVKRFLQESWPMTSAEFAFDGYRYQRATKRQKINDSRLNLTSLPSDEELIHHVEDLERMTTIR